MIGLAPHADSDEREGAEGGSGNKYRQMARLRAFHLMALFILVYVGTEVTLGGGYMRSPRCMGKGYSSCMHLVRAIVFI